MNQSNGSSKEIPHVVKLEGFEIHQVDHPVIVDLSEEEVFIPVMDPFMFVYFTVKHGNWTMENTNIVAVKLEDYLEEYARYGSQIESFPDSDRTAEDVKQEAISIAYEIQSKRLN